MIARSLLLAAGVASAAACGSQSSPGSSGSGLYGNVVISPSSPVCVTGQPCTKPAKHFKLVFGAGGQSVTATTDDHGRYRVELDGGRYVVRSTLAGNAAPKNGLQPRTVSVPAGRFAKRDFVYDSGIR